jgi:hypothetical protein
MAKVNGGNGKNGGNGRNGNKGNCSDPGRCGKNGRPICPYCREKDEVIPIFYGFPTDKTFMKAERGEVYLGGCIAGPTAYYCKRDDREF